MTEYRHITNLRRPYDELDQKLLDALWPGYKISAPIPATEQESPSPLSLTDLVATGIVGLYVTWDAIHKPSVMAKTGWGHMQHQNWRKLPLFDDGSLVLDSTEKTV